MVAVVVATLMGPWRVITLCSTEVVAVISASVIGVIALVVIVMAQVEAAPRQGKH